MTGRQQLWCGSSVEVLGLVRWYLLMSTFGGSINPGDNRGHCATANFSTNKNNFSDLFMTFYMFHWTANREILWKELAAFWNTLSGRKIVHVSIYSNICKEIFMSDKSDPTEYIMWGGWNVSASWGQESCGFWYYQCGRKSGINWLLATDHLNKQL